MTLKEFLTNHETGKLKRGSVARVAEALKVNRSTVCRHLRGHLGLSAEMMCRIQNLIHSRLEIFAKTPGPNGRKKKIARNFRAAKSA